MVEIQTNQPTPEFPFGQEKLAIRAFQNAHRAWQYADRIARKKEAISEETIKQIHFMVMDGILPESATGKYRTCNVGISQASVTPPHYLRVPELMRELVSDLNNKIEPLKTAPRTRESLAKKIQTVAFSHYIFVRIHPFEDGNGRTGRLFADLVAKLLDLKPIIIWPSQKERYLDSLEAVNRSGNLAHFELFLLQRLEERYWISQNQEMVEEIRILIHQKQEAIENQKRKEGPTNIWDKLPA